MGISPDTGITNLICDKVGNITGKVDARGGVVTYGHDALNRRTCTVYAGVLAEPRS